MCIVKRKYFFTQCIPFATKRGSDGPQLGRALKEDYLNSCRIRVTVAANSNSFVLPTLFDTVCFRIPVVVARVPFLLVSMIGHYNLFPPYPYVPRSALGM